MISAVDSSMPVMMVCVVNATATLVMTMVMTTMKPGETGGGEHHAGQDGALARE